MAGDLRPGEVFSGYRLLGPILRGGLSEVAPAVPPGGGAPVAVKVLDAEASRRPDLRARVASALPALREIEHPGLLRVADVGEEDGRLFVALPWVEALDLRSVVRGAGPLAPHGVAGVAAAAADALDALEAAEVTHADVKPGNVLTTRDARHVGGPSARVLLGHSWLAWEHGGPRGRYTVPGEFVGTVDYAAPEVIEGSLGDRRSDVYALGCTLFECLTGRPPFAREDEEATLEAHLEAPPPVLEGMPASLTEVVARALAKDPADRYATAGSLAAALQVAMG